MFIGLCVPLWRMLAMTRNEFLRYLTLSVTGTIAAIAASCSSAPAPDAETEPSPEWPPKEEE
jgi:hypothetical protein